LSLTVDIFVLALTAALNPSLLTATTVMLFLPNPRRLMLGYLLGALMTSITLGSVIVFSLEDSGSVSTSKNTLSPAANIALGLLALVVAGVLRGERDVALKERRERKKATKEDTGPPRWQQALSKGTARTTFVVGALLTLPGASYLAALTRIAKDDLGVVPSILVIVGFNLIMLALLELPLLSYWLAPDTTPDRIERAKAALGRNGRRIGIRVATIGGVLLLIRGVLELLA
jgi:hypothetical protein